MTLRHRHSVSDALRHDAQSGLTPQHGRVHDAVRSARTARNGAALLELLVAIPILALLAAIAVALLLNAQRAAQRTDQTLAVSHELRHASAVLASALRPLTPHDLVAWADSAIEFESTIATGIVCNGRSPLDRVDLLAAVSVDAARMHELMPVQSNDRLIAYTASLDSTLSPEPQIGTVRSLGTSNACLASPLVDSSPDPGAHTLSIRLAHALPDHVLAGSPVRITRIVRYALYRSGSTHFLGRQERNAAGWDVIQPVAGPLLSTAARGLRISVRDAAGAPLLSGDSSAASVHIELRAAARVTPRSAAAHATRLDSTLLTLALRAAPPR